MNLSAINYLATPYTHRDPNVRNRRYMTACKLAAHLMSEGYVIFSPIAHSHVVSHVGGIETSWDFWKRQDEALLKRFDCLVVATMAGWRESVGVREEIEIAKRAGIPVRYLDPVTMRATDEAPAEEQSGDKAMERDRKNLRAVVGKLLEPLIALADLVDEGQWPDIPEAEPPTTRADERAAEIIRLLYECGYIVGESVKLMIDLKDDE